MAAKKRLITSLLRPSIIAAVALLLVVVILTVSHQSFKVTEETTLNEFNRRQLVMAREAASGIEFYFETLATSLKAIGKAPEVIQFQKAAIRRILSFTFEELAWLGVNDIAVMDSRGNVQCTAATHQLEGIHLSWRGYLQKIREMHPDPTYFLDFIDIKGNGAGQKGILVAVPIIGHPADGSHSIGKFTGVVLCTLKLDALIEKFLAPIQSSAGGYVFLIEKGYHVLWSPDVSLFGKNLLKEAEGFPSLQHILQRMNSGISGIGEFTFLRFDESAKKFAEDKEAKLTAYVPIRLGQEQWSLGVWSPKKTASKLIRSSYLQQLFLVSLIVSAILVGSLFTIAMANRYSRSLEKEVREKVREIQESHQRLLTVFDSLDAWVYVADLETFEILYINKYMRDLFGNVNGKKCWQVLHKGLRGPCKFCMSIKQPCADGDTSAEFHVRKIQSTITGRWYEARDRVIHWVDGRTVKLEIAYDITERKQVEDELLRAHHEMGTFCRIIKEIGVQQTLNGVGSFLMAELKTILETHEMLLMVLSDDNGILFTLSDRETLEIKDQELVQKSTTLLTDLSGITIAPKKIFKPPIIPDYFSNKGRQTIVPFQVQGQTAGALIIVCKPDCRCEEKELELVGLILDQASGAIKRAARHEEEIRALQGRINPKIEFNGIIGKDAKMQVIYKLIEDIAPTDATVLIQGESGTGKELVARAIHYNSLRKDNPFIVINCSAYPASLLESELFGHMKGAFTGATRQKAGRFEQAHGGTVFLDEIGEIPPSAQIKLLRVLQSQRFERLGGEETLSVDVRILAATNKNLLQEVKEGRFREDLFYRLHVIPVNLPPLRERLNDIPLIARHFQEKFAKEQGWNIQDFTSEAMRCLLDYMWPGNVRELENSIEHAVVLSKGQRIGISHLPSGLCDSHSPSLRGSQRTILENEKKLLIEVLLECDWNKTQAALRLGISRSTLYDKIKKYQIAKSS